MTQRTVLITLCLESGVPECYIVFSKVFLTNIQSEQKYARLVPLYLAEMTALQSTDPDIYQEFMDGNFVVNKNQIPFCAIIIIIIISTTMFMVLSSWQSHCESSPGSFDECRMAPSGRRPKTKPGDLGCESACTGCQKLHPLSPFIITQPES